ncbi:hypothetical protein Arad_7210 [Rhizobium rhizogenes K84]|uniref:Uncharacterized protein n=1 Tax=Rhizobium rhizogenes (strain K84 / ATCC BAA-868) TaxID=311403 RepID=B9JM46_RHIR8|nr:hypothetical protein Arad_7210 [Rhizobium rhizogenes K84]
MPGGPKLSGASNLLRFNIGGFDPPGSRGQLFIHFLENARFFQNKIEKQKNRLERARSMHPFLMIIAL